MKKEYVLLGISVALSACSNGGSGSSSNSSPIIAFPSVFYAQPGSSTLITGVRGIGNPAESSSSNVYLSGIYMNESINYGIVYQGSLTSPSSYSWSLPISYPGESVVSTSFYGPNNGLGNGNIQIAGSYSTVQSNGNGFGLLYQGPVPLVNGSAGRWITLLPQSIESAPIINTVAHNVMGGFVVGNYDTHLITGKAFIYDIESNTYYSLVKPGAISNTAYGIWQNSESSYTIVGGYSNAIGGLTIGYIVDWNSITHIASNWTSYSYNNQPVTSTSSHFEGITTDGSGGYNLASNDGTIYDFGGGILASFVHVKRVSPAGPFEGVAQWINIPAPSGATISSNTVFGNSILGVYSYNLKQFYPYLVTVTP